MGILSGWWFGSSYKKSLPIDSGFTQLEHGGSFHSFLYVETRGYPIVSPYIIIYHLVGGDWNIGLVWDNDG